mmetsp:Transcript_22957/g.45989  ORF Transcript_22957/g.45989 Transcript_22957/m.45989 type:complete len:95 (-) Transcript_22957:493-777(-)
MRPQRTADALRTYPHLALPLLARNSYAQLRCPYCTPAGCTPAGCTPAGCTPAYRIAYRYVIHSYRQVLRRANVEGVGVGDVEGDDVEGDVEGDD